MPATENLNLPYVLPSQSQKHVSLNEALRTLDALVQLSVLSRGVLVPPASPAAGDRYIVPREATGAWSGYENHIAAWQDDFWLFYMPHAGWLAYASDDELLLVFDGVAWETVSAGSALPDRLGLNATAEAPNRLALAGAASLFSHEGAGHQLKINKSASADTASVLFQKGFSGRAEFGLAGDDDLHVKVSADGASFTEALLIDRNSGRATFPAGVTGLRQQLTADRTYHVATTGSDLNDGLSAASSFATLQKAVDEAHKLDCSIYDVTIQLADGTYPGAKIVRGLVGGGLLSIIGNDEHTNSVTLSSGIFLSGVSEVYISGIRFEIFSDWINSVEVGFGAHLRIGKIDFGLTGENSDHINSQSPCKITIEKDYSISGNARRHIGVGRAAVVGINRTITLIGNPRFSQFFFVGDCGGISLWNLAIIGESTGSRFHVGTNGIINLFGRPSDFLPGDAAGSITEGGIYA